MNEHAVSGEPEAISKEAFDAAEFYTGLEPATIRDLFDKGWICTLTENGPRWNAPATLHPAVSGRDYGVLRTISQERIATAPIASPATAGRDQF